MQRRTFLLTAPAAVLAACGADPDTGGPAGEKADLAVLGAALELELSSRRLYEIGLALRPRERRLLERIRDHESAHVQGIEAAIEDLEGEVEPRRGRLDRGFPRMRDERAFLGYALEFERRSAEAYAAALPRVRTGRLRSTFGSILAVEAEHAAALGSDPLERVLPL